ncbi:MAG: hypothetical protein CL424_14705 [Acidimicrobiaceae bacterium]|nr:hypothetical protein [Acidimicrobiaceae bacterium]
MKSRTAPRTIALGVSALLLWFALPAGVAWAQVPDPAPDSSLPGGELITQVLGWLKYAAIAAAVAGLMIGGVATGVGHFGSSYSASSAGRKWVLGGIGAAMLAGLAHTIATTVYEAS